MSNKKFCMDCAGELIIAADGSVGICSKCGKSYTFTSTPIEPTAVDVGAEYKEKVVALMELGKKNEAIELAEKYVNEQPQDYRAYVLRGALELDLYKLAPVDAVIERKWLEALERFEAAKKIATDEQIASMKEEFGDYCERAEEVVKIFYDLYLMKKADSAAPVAPCDSRGALFAQRESMEQKIAVSEKKLSALQEKKDLEESTDEVQQLREQPITAKGLFAKAKMKKMIRARENLYELMERQKAYRLKEVSDAIAEAEKTLLDEKTKLTEINEKLETQTKKYQNELERYEKELAEYNGIVAEREEKERVYASNPVAQAILAKLVSIEEKMAEYQKEIDRLNKESKPFAYNGSTFNTTEYYLQQATYRDREQRLTREKIQITGKINDLRFMLLARKPQAPFFN